MHPLRLTHSFFTAILTRTKQLFDCRLNNVKLQQKKFTILLTFSKYWGVVYVFQKFGKVLLR